MIVARRALCSIGLAVIVGGCLGNDSGAADLLVTNEADQSFEIHLSVREFEEAFELDSEEFRRFDAALEHPDDAVDDNATITINGGELEAGFIFSASVTSVDIGIASEEEITITTEATQ